MEIFIITAFVAMLGMVFMISRHLPYLRKITHEQINYKMSRSRSLRGTIYNITINPFINLWHKHLHAELLNLLMKIIKRFRIIILKIERILFKFTNYIRGKHEAKKNGETKYWKDINDFKNDLNNSNDDNQ